MMKLTRHYNSRPLRIGKLVALSLFAVLALAFNVPMALAEAPPPTPDLPVELRDPSGKLTLLDFFSPSCGACMMMEPHTERLRIRTADKVSYKKIDLSETANTKYMDSYGVTATPTYLLFDANGKPLYRMESMIVPTVLEKQVLRETGQLTQVDFPSGVLSSISATPVKTDDARLANLLLVAFENPGCPSCKTMAPYLAGFEMAGQDGLSIIHVNTDSVDGKALIGKLSLEKVPSYVLFDNANDTKEELVRLDGNIKPKDLWNVIRLFGSDGLKTPLPDGDEE